MTDFALGFFAGAIAFCLPTLGIVLLLSAARSEKGEVVVLVAEDEDEEDETK